jgi:hypothetical protein
MIDVLELVGNGVTAERATHYTIRSIGADVRGEATL